MQKDFFSGSKVGMGSVTSVTLTNVGGAQDIAVNDAMSIPPIDETISAISPRGGEKELRESTTKV